MQNKIAKSQNQNVFQNLPKPINWNDEKKTLVALDADGTIINMTGGDHWFTLINEMPSEVRERIKSRVSIMGPRSEKWAQQYLSAASLYEFTRHKWTMKDLIPFAEKVEIREDVVQLVKKLSNKHKVVIISYGIKEFLESVIQHYGLSSYVNVYANSIFSKKTGAISPPANEFIPEYMKYPDDGEGPDDYVKFVRSMTVVPATKGNILKALMKSNKSIKQVLSVGDSAGDIEMFRETIKLGGISILHSHTDNAPKYIWEAKNFEVFNDTVTYFSVNKTNNTFAPTTKLISDLLL